MGWWSGMGMSPPPSFGRGPDEGEQQGRTVASFPVLNLGPVEAELVLRISEESLREAGSAIASMIANATVQGFAAGWQHLSTDDEDPSADRG